MTPTKKTARRRSLRFRSADIHQTAASAPAAAVRHQADKAKAGHHHELGGSLGDRGHRKECLGDFLMRRRCRMNAVPIGVSGAVRAAGIGHVGKTKRSRIEREPSKKSHHLWSLRSLPLKHCLALPRRGLRGWLMKSSAVEAVETNAARN